MSATEIVRLDWQVDQFVDEQTLTRWEVKSGYTLPDDYRSFLLKYNGGVVRPWLFRHEHPLVPEDSREKMLDYLHEWQSVLKGSQLDVPRDLANQPPAHLLIGQNPGGGGIMMSLRPESLGAVFYWLRTHLVWDDPPNNVLGFIAPSFTAFLQSLYDDGETDHGYWKVLARERRPVPLVL